jgi:DNA modification methylase
MLPDNNVNYQRYDDRLAIHAISTDLPYDVGMENLLIGANQRIIASSI